jgi:signal transduction histidine kinase
MTRPAWTCNISRPEPLACKDVQMAQVKPAPPWQPRNLAVVLGGLVLDLVGFSQILAGPAVFPTWVAGYAAAGYVVLLWRRSAPRVVFAVMLVHAAVAAVAIPTYGPVIGLMIALFTISERTSFATGLWALTLSFLPTVFLVAGEVWNAPPELAIPTMAASFTMLSLANSGAWSLGRWARSHREQLDLLEQRRVLEAQEAVTDERTRIARDLHDIVSHSVGVMTLQAAGARQVLINGNQPRAEQALSDIEGVGTQAMVELRRMLTVLRDPETEPGTEPDRPGLADLEPLVDRMVAAEVPTRLVSRGEPRPLDAGTELTVYRVVQESLTNVAKHAGADASAVVELEWSEQELSISITNTTSGPARISRDSTGHGLVGLRERVAAVGGRVEAGPTTGGFQVTAVLPLTQKN